MDKGEIGVGRETARVVERGAIVELVEGDDIVVWVGEREVADEPAGAVWGGEVSVEGSDPAQRGGKGERGGTNMNPAPPVTRMFLQSNSGANSVLPVSTGASFQMPESWKWSWMGGAAASLAAGAGAR